MTEATCPRCDRTLPLMPEYWYRNRARPTGFDSYCKQCHKAMVKTPEYRNRDRQYRHQHEHLPHRKMYRQAYQSRIVHVDEQVYDIILQHKADLEQQRGRSVSKGVALRDLLKQVIRRSTEGRTA